MQKYNQGHVVNIEFPNQEDPKKSTYHPAIVVEDLEDEVLLVFMTKQLDQESRYPKSFVIEKSSEEGKLMGLGYDSLICPERTVTVNKVRIFPPPRGGCSESMIDDLLDLI